MLLTVSEYSRKQISRHYSIDEKKSLITPNAVSDDFYEIDKTKAQRYVDEKGVRKYLLYVSRIEPRKNQIALLKSYDELNLHDLGYDLVFIGRKTLSTPEFDNYLNGMSEQSKKHVYIYNQVAYDELKYWYKAASLFVYPALAEGFGIPPIEAASAEIPCVCSNRTAMGDFTFFGENLIDTTNIGELKDRIISVLNEETDVKKISGLAKNKYNWKSIAREFYNMLSLK